MFDVVAKRQPKRNKFDLGHSKKYSCKMGQLIPAQVTEVLPGDSFQLRPQIMTRFAPLVSPVMHRIRVYRHYFFVPNRLLWTGFPDYMAGKDDIGEHPYITGSSVVSGSLGDYMGLATGAYQTGKLNALPFAGYALIWDEWYRSQQLQEKRFVPLVAGSNNAAYGSMLSTGPYLRGWQRDVFTSALPEAQQGDPITLPLTSTDELPVTYRNRAAGAANQNTGQFRTVDGEVFEDDANILNEAPGPTPLIAGMNASGNFLAYDPAGTLVVTPNLEAVTIATLRWAVRMQEFLELAARTGQRYKEVIEANFPTRVSDARLQRPEYIGGTIGNAVISEVLSTAQTLNGAEIANPVGAQAGHAIAVNGGNYFQYTAEEHGWLYAIDSVIPETAYMQGNHRSFCQRTDRFDYAWPTFGQLGEQAILNKEIYAESADPDGTFGYNVRYNEYKYMPSSVAGEFRDSLDFWTLARKFPDEPTLSSDFIECNIDTEDLTRIFAVTAGADHLYVNAINDCSVLRALPRYNIPTL